ncbi:MAG: helix-turn-helix domain-containing protein [Aquabacterium sp.]|nr:helix-turn-helix domain-containing protein [Aquabacterium sp.]
MTESHPPSAEPLAEGAVGSQAGALLRAARQQQGMHIMALAAAIKVTPAKLEALEAGRYHELPDATFTRALALTICRVLKIDPTPVLAQLPGARDIGLGRVDGGLNTPFRDRPGRTDPSEWAPWRRPVLWLVGLLLLAAAAFVLVPSTPGPAGPLVSLPGVGAAADAIGAAVLPPGASAPVVPAVTPAAVASEAASPAASTAASPAAASAPVAVAASATGVPGAAVAGDALVLRAVQATWVQAVDGAGQTLMARLVPAGETVELTATPPLRLRIGNAQGTELQFRGHPVDLAAAARDNIANITLP